MNLTRSLQYDASVGAVVAMMQHPDFWDQVATATAAISSSTTVTGSGDAIVVRTDQRQAVTGVPSFAKKFVGESTQAISTHTWSGSSADVVVDAPGKPTSITGTLVVAEAGAGSTLTYSLEVKASVPLIGGKLEKLVCDLTGAGFDLEQGVGTAWLAEHA